MRWTTDARVFAVVSDENVATALPIFRPADVAGLADCVVERLDLRR
jgi:hypothetical protein